MLLSKHRKKGARPMIIDCHVHAGELNKHYPVWWIEELYRVWGGVLASLNRRAAAPAAGSGTLDDLERCRVFRALIDHLVDNAPLHRHFAGQAVVALERVLDFLERLAGVLHEISLRRFLRFKISWA